MPRFEVTIASGEKIVVDHGAPSMAEFLTDIHGKDFLLLTEIIGAAAGATREIIITGGQITMIRPLSDLSTQGSNFRPKR